MAKDTAAAKPLTKGEIKQRLVDSTGITLKQAGEVLDAINALAAEQVSGVGSFALPGLLKIVRVTKPAQPAKIGVPNPFKKGELMDVAAKPPKKLVKIRALKALKDAVA